LPGGFQELVKPAKKMVKARRGMAQLLPDESHVWLQILQA